MVNKENIKKWVSALRSGNFKQGRGCLGFVDLNGNKFYCCLGVACEIAIQDGTILNQDKKYRTFSYDNDQSVLPTAVRSWLGVEESNPTFSNGKPAIDMNDITNNSFDEIADAIEETYLKD